MIYYVLLGDVEEFPGESIPFRQEHRFTRKDQGYQIIIIIYSTHLVTARTLNVLNGLLTSRLAELNM